MEERLRQNTILVAATAVGWVLWGFYALSPIDLIPDLLPLLGWIDDAFGLSALVGLTLLTFHRLSEAGQLAASRREAIAYEPVSQGELQDW